MKHATRIQDVLEAQGKRAIVTLTENRFHPSGGGQPGDTGFLRGDGFDAEVKDCLVRGGMSTLVLRVQKGRPEKGMTVEAWVDRERNFFLSRMHTGEHILSRVLENENEGLHVRKVSIGEEESSISLSWDGQIRWEMLFDAENKAQEVILKDLPVETRIVEREEAKGIPGLKINWERIGDSRIRVVSIVQFDVMACSGTHADSTGQVGGILVTGFRGSPPDWSINFTVHRERILTEYGRVVRPLLRSIGCPLQKLSAVYETLQKDRKELAKSLDKVKDMLDVPWQTAASGGCHVYYIALEGLPLELVTPSVKKLSGSKADAIVIALLENEPGKASFVLSKGSRCRLDLREVIRRNPHLRARGGGAPEWVQGETLEISPHQWVEALRELTNSNH